MDTAERSAKLHVSAISVLFFLAFSASAIAEGVLGATCSAIPVCTDCAGEGNVCRTVKDRFFPGVTMIVALDAVIEQCKRLNALDECGNHCLPEKREEILAGTGTCYSQCESVANCIYLDNR